MAYADRPRCQALHKRARGIQVARSGEGFGFSLAQQQEIGCALAKLLELDPAHGLLAFARKPSEYYVRR